MVYITGVFSYFSISALQLWWRSLDKILLVLICMLFALGIITSFSVPSSNYSRLNFMDDTIVNIRFLIFAIMGVVVFFIASALSLKWIRRLCVLGGVVILCVLILLPFIGFENKGAIRWLMIGGISVQPSEFAKPLFVVISAWLFSARYNTTNIPASGLSAILYGVFAFLFIIQPDFGQTLLLTGMWLAQLWVAGLSIGMIPVIFVLLIILMGIAYTLFPHVDNRVQGFLNQGNADTYQVHKSLEAFQSGGLFGQGLGSGRIKKELPDSHTDFIFAVYAEEGGMILAILVLSLFVVIIMRMLWLSWHKNDAFSMIAMVGICVQFSMQTAINIASTIGLIPAKGMTLPLISMGGSSYVAIAGTLGVFMAFSRRRKYEG